MAARALGARVAFGRSMWKSCVSALKPFDHETPKKCKNRQIHLEDHNVACGLGRFVTQSLEESGAGAGHHIAFVAINSGTADELYEIAGL